MALCAAVLVLLSGCGDTQLKTLSGEDVSWKQQRGQWVFINYWAQWCQPCRKEIPELNQFALQHEGEAVILGVNFDGPEYEDLEKQTRAMGIEFTQLLHDPSGLLGFDRPEVLPATYVFDPKGVYQGVMVGPQTEASLGAWLKDDPKLAVIPMAHELNSTEPIERPQ
nr:TlpA disulfide reductase family protein [Aestuariicella albida]